jgi:hypothetical protein
MQWSKVSAVAALLLLLGGCAVDADDSTQEPSPAGTAAEQHGTQTSQVVESKPAALNTAAISTSQTPAPPVDPGQQVESETTDPSKPQPDPWKGATFMVAPSKPQPDPWTPDKSHNTSAQLGPGPPATGPRCERAGGHRSD